MNYRHKAAADKGKKVKPDELNQSLIDKTPTPSLNSEAPVEDFSMYGMDMTCCICMENFGEEHDNEAGNPYSSVEVVILPCKAHYFHEPCIAAWMEKQNACPVCRVEITIDGLKKQKKELAQLMKAIEKDQKAVKSGAPRDSVKDGEDTSSLLINP